MNIPVTTSEVEIAGEWDQLAPVRHRQIASGIDLSFHEVLKPFVLTSLSKFDATDVIDIGCGTGELTGELASVSGTVVGIDISGESIRIAQSNPGRKNLSFSKMSVDQYAHARPESFSLAVANMTLASAVDLSLTMNAVRVLLRHGGMFVGTIPHPWFWPRYWGYENEPWFSYEREQPIKAPFKISREQTGLTTTHIHRSLKRYVESFLTAGLSIVGIDEPAPRATADSSYRNSWKYPRFLGIHARYP